MSTKSLMQLIQEKKAALNSNKRQKTIKPADGRSRFRILPGWRTDGDPQFYHDFGQHFIKDAKGDIKAVYVCVDKTYGKPCQVCDALGTAIKASSDDAMVSLLKEAGASGRVLMNVLHIDGENPSEPQILEVAPTVFGEILNIISEWGAEVLDLASGKDIIIERTGKGKNTRYSVQIAAKSGAVDASVMKKVVNLDEYVAQESEEQARRALSNLSAVAGLLSAPEAAKPSMASMSIGDVEDVADATLSIPSEPKPTPAAAPAPAPTPAAAPATPAAPAAAASTGDAELDNLLAELG